MLSEGETIVKMGMVRKRRRIMNVKKRMLILTDSPRLMYINPMNMRVMGTIPFGDLNAIYKNKTHFIIKTVCTQLCDRGS